MLSPIYQDVRPFNFFRPFVSVLRVQRSSIGYSRDATVFSFTKPGTEKYFLRWLIGKEFSCKATQSLFSHSVVLHARLLSSLILKEKIGSLALPLALSAL